MPSHYSIIRYVPDPIADERINVGVIVVGDRDVRMRFLTNWHRVKDFSSANIKFVRDFASSLQARHRLMPADDHWDLEELTRLSHEWANSIQFSEPRASLKSAPDLFDEVVARYLRDEALP